LGNLSQLTEVLIMSEVKKTIKSKNSEVKEAPKRRGRPPKSESQVLKSYVQPSLSIKEPLPVKEEKPVEKVIEPTSQKKRGRKEATETVKKGVEKQSKKSDIKDLSFSSEEDLKPDSTNIEQKSELRLDLNMTDTKTNNEDCSNGKPVGMLKTGSPVVPNFIFTLDNVPKTDAVSVKTKRIDFN
jgi:hypothetical protein